MDKIYDVIGLYLNPPETAVVLCVDEKSQVQALGRSQPAFPMMPGMPEKRTHDYVRNGTTSLFAAFNIADGTVFSSLHRRHRSIEFKKFLTKIDAEVPADFAVHLVCDNYSTHKSPAIKAWLAAHPRFQIHFTPTHSSWINQVERFFAFVTEDLLQRSHHDTVHQLEADIRGWIKDWNTHPKPFIWTKTADEILESLGRLLKRISGAGHSPIGTGVACPWPRSSALATARSAATSTPCANWATPSTWPAARAGTIARRRQPAAPAGLRRRPSRRSRRRTSGRPAHHRWAQRCRVSCLGHGAAGHPSRLRHLVGRIEITSIWNAWDLAAPNVDQDLLLAVSAALRNNETLRYDYDDSGSDEAAPAREIQPHYIVMWAGRWYLLGYDLAGARCAWTGSDHAPRTAHGSGPASCPSTTTSPTS